MSVAMSVAPLIPTFTEAQIDMAAQELRRRRLLGQPGTVLPESSRPNQVADAFAVQQAVVRLAGDVIGWKCGLPSLDDAGRPKIVVAPLYQHELQRGAVCKLWPSVDGKARVEPEYAYPVTQDIAAGDTELTEAVVYAHLGMPHLALELIQSRYLPDAGAGYPDQLADGLFNQGLWLGPVLCGSEQQRFQLQIGSDGTPPVPVAARHPNDNPRAPLVWLVNFLRAQGIALHAGQYLITGSFAGVLEYPFATVLHWQFGDEPVFQLSFLPR